MPLRHVHCSSSSYIANSGAITRGWGFGPIWLQPTRLLVAVGYDLYECNYSLYRIIMTSLVQLLSGRKRESGIWDYFMYNKDTDKSECKVVLGNKDKICGKPVSGKNATNLKAHVRAAHPSV